MSARLRLTLSYVGFLLLAAAAMLALLVYVIRFIPDANLQYAGGVEQGFVPGQRDLLRAFWPRALQVFVVLMIVGTVTGWLLAGYMLRPLDRLARVAEQVSSGSLEHRADLTRTDEFGRLGRTFDAMLDTLQASFDEQQRFTANVSHELRTPYAISRLILDVALADPENVDVPRLLERLDSTTRRGTHAVDALLTIATLDHLVTLERRPVDIAELVSRVLEDAQPLADDAGVTVTAELGEGDVDGHEDLIAQLTMNLVLNGIRHNLPAQGTLQVTTTTRADGGVELRISNTGPVIGSDTAGTLVEPFVRGRSPGGPPPGARPRIGGTGLGLTIVARVARLHGARLGIEPHPSGGLEVTVVFPVDEPSTADRSPGRAALP